MNRKKHFISMILLLTTFSYGYSQEIIRYKQVDTIDLFMEVHYPENLESPGHFPAMVFFFGGGWVGGDRTHFSHHAEYFSKRGLTSFLVDYRTKSKHKTTPFESLKDAK